MKKKVRVVVIALVCISLVAGYYYYLNHEASTRTADDQTQQTEVEKVLAKNLEKSYPQTPRSVVKMYNRILLCLYNEEYTDEQFEDLADQQRMLLDEDLLEANPRDTYLEFLKADVASYKNAEKQITVATVCGSADVVNKKVKGEDCAYVTSSYFMKEANKSYARTVQEYVLRQNEDGDWKIIGFYLKEGDSENE